MEESSTKQLVIDIKAVKRSIEVLRSQKIHEHFPGYLFLKLESRQKGQTKDLKPPFKTFFDEFLKPGDAPEEKPYIRPFTRTGTPASDIWMNKNVAGSYAPSSIRGNSPLRHVVLVNDDKTYSLNSNHAKLAFQYLALGSKIPSVSLAIFMLRDYGFEGESVDISTILSTFRDIFGFREEIESEKEEYQTLFLEDLSTYKKFDSIYNSFETGEAS
ncbi:TPA: hypothetical protein ACPVXB_003208 [Vibrio parahaemolyticus]